MSNIERMSIEELSIHTIRTLAIDAIQKANSGHPGAAMGLAPLSYVLWSRFLKHNPQNPNWFDRDRFVLSCGHASMLLYTMLYLTGYDLTLDDIKQFRQWGSRTPGHPEYGITPGVEMTTGPLGQGAMTSVGMAMAEAHLAAVYNREDHKIVDHYTYAICGDGDLMEGASHEAASIAGHFGLGKLIWIYDDNHVSLEGPTDLCYSDDVARRFEGYHWHVQNIGDHANDLAMLSAALEKARAEKDRPSLIIVRSHIGYGSPNKQDSFESHGAPLGEDEIRLVKKFYGWPEDEHFLVPEQALRHMRRAGEAGPKIEQEWQERFAAYQKAFPDLARQFEQALKCELPAGWEKDIPVFKPSDGSMATRVACGKVITSFCSKVPWMMSGTADLAPSTKTLLKGAGYFAKSAYANRNIAWGVREHAMCAATSGIALHKGVRSFAATFFVFTDYCRPAIRLASIMELPVLYLMTHDSIGLGEDGPTHQPIEHLASLRAMPGLCIIRPADANEVSVAWQAALTRKKGPTIMVLSRQNLPILDRGIYASPEGVLKGAYVLAPEKRQAQAILIASGSEVSLVLAAWEKLAEEGIDARVVSMPSWELFREQPEKYRNEVLPPEIKARLAVEAGAPQGWREWVGDGGDIIAIPRFGASAPDKELFQQFGFTVENVLSRIRKLVGKK
jgi:transketolase